MNKEERYIFYRKMKALGSSMLFYMMRVFPIQNNKIAVCTYEGKGGFGCNPKYIVEEMHRRSNKYKFIWFVNDMSKIFPEYVIKKKNNIWNRAYHLSTSKIWIDNYRKPLGTKKREKQLYIQTWHGAVGFKAIGEWRGEGFSKIAYMVSKNDSDMIDYVVTNSEWCLEAYPKGLVYSGKYLNVGCPRCDIMVNNRDEQRIIIREKYNLSATSKIVMFAPTYREKGQKTKRGVYIEQTDLDFERMMQAFTEKFGGEWYLFMRLHPQLVSQIDKYPLDGIREHVIDVSNEDDMCEILAAVDAIVTDYSSAAIDASYVGIPAFLYIDDLDTFVKDRGDMFFNINPPEPIRNNKKMAPGVDVILPYPVARNNKEFVKNIMEFNLQKYINNVSKMCTDLKIINDGKASQKVAEIIEKEIR